MLRELEELLRYLKLHENDVMPTIVITDLKPKICALESAIEKRR